MQTIPIVLAAAVLAAAVLAAGAAMAQNPPPPAPPPAVATQLTATGFVQAAAMSNLFELQSSQLVLERSANPQVKGFAAEMVTDHSKAGENLAIAQAKAGGTTTIPDTLDTPHRNQLAQLIAAQGAALDRAYVRAQVQAHDEAVGVFSAYARGGDNPTLKAFAAQTLPVLQHHQQQIRTLAASAR